MKSSEINPGEKNKNTMPFRESLIDSGLAGSLYEFEKSKDMVVRRETLGSFRDTFRGMDPIEGIKKSKELFGELENKYNIQVVPFSRVVGNNEDGKATVYTISKKIKGENLEKKEFNNYEKKEVIKQLELLYSSLLQYLEDKHKHGGYYFTDIFNNYQYVWRESKNEKQNIYLVDVDSCYTKYYLGPGVRAVDDFDFFFCLRGLAAMITIMEDKLGGIKFKDARNRFFSFLDSLKKCYPDKAYDINMILYA